MCEQAVFAARGDIARTLDSNPDPLGDATPSSRGGAPSRPRAAVLFGAACSASVDCPLCRPVGLAHGLDRARLQHLGRTQFWPRAPLAMRRPPPEEVPPQGHRWRPPSERPAPSRSTVFVQASWPCTWPRPCAVAVPQPHSIVAPGPLGDATPSSRGGAPSRPQVAALSRAACCASVNRLCVGHLALHMALTVRGCGPSPLDSESPKPLGLVQQICRLHKLKMRTNAFVFLRVGGLPQQRVWFDRPKVFQVCTTIHVHRASVCTTICVHHTSVHATIRVHRAAGTALAISSTGAHSLVLYRMCTLV
jgi:hypothetical protein